MKIKFHFVPAVMSVVLSCAKLFAQEPVIITMPPGEAQWPRAGFLLLKQKSVDNELKLTAEQRKTLDFYQKEVSKAFDSIPGMFARIAELNRIYFAAIKALKLDPKQSARLHQIHFRLCFHLERGLIFNDSSVTKHLEFTSRQTTDSQAILRKCQDAERKISRTLSKAKTEQMRNKLRQQAALAIYKLFTPAQKKKFQELAGPAFRGVLTLRGRAIRLN